MLQKENKSFCFMLQARLGSTRLPRKMIIPFHGDKSILQIIIEKLKLNFPDIPLVLATSNHSDNNELESLGLQLNCHVYRGSENDVLNRFIEAADKFNFKNIIRVCADNPFLNVNDMARLINFINNNKNFDYVSFKVNGKPSIKTHFGFWGEYVSLKALKTISNFTNEDFYHEHVTNYIYENPKDFFIRFLEVEQILSQRNDIRMTLDTQEDFYLLAEIYSKLFNDYGELFGINEIVNFLDNNSKYLLEMKNQIVCNSK